MITNPQVARRYAKSLLELAQQRGVLEAVRQDMALLVATANENRSLRLLLASPIISPVKKQSALKALFGASFNELSTAFIALLSKKGRETDLYGIALAFEQQYNKLSGISVAKLTTAAPITEALREQFKALVAKETGNTVSLQEEVDASILGGFRLQMGDRQIDSTVKSKLAALRLNLIDNTYISKL